MTAPASCTPRSTPMSKPPPRPGSGRKRPPGIPRSGSHPSEYSPTTGPVTAPDSGTNLRRHGHHRDKDPTPSTPNQRQDRTLPPHPPRGPTYAPGPQSTNAAPPTKRYPLLQSLPRPRSARPGNAHQHHRGRPPQRAHLGFARWGIRRSHHRLANMKQTTIAAKQPGRCSSRSLHRQNSDLCTGPDRRSGKNAKANRLATWFGFVRPFLAR